MYLSLHEAENLNSGILNFNVQVNIRLPCSCSRLLHLCRVCRTTASHSTYELNSHRLYKMKLALSCFQRISSSKCKIDISQVTVL